MLHALAISLDLVILIIFGEEYKPLSSSLCNFCPAPCHFIPFGSDVLLFSIGACAKGNKGPLPWRDEPELCGPVNSTRAPYWLGQGDRLS